MRYSTKRWLALGVLALLAACAEASHGRKPPPPPPPEGPPRSYEPKLSVARGRVSLFGTMCAGDVVGDLLVTWPSGEVERIKIQVPSYEKRCADCQMGTREPTDACFETCDYWNQEVKLTDIPVDDFDGLFHVSTRELTLTCAPDRLRAGELTFEVRGGVTHVPPQSTSAASASALPAR